MKQTEKRERRLIVRFILIVLACGVLGYFVGMFMAEYGGNIHPLPQGAMESITRMFPFLFAGYNLVLFAACLIINRKAKGLLTAWDGEEETVLDTIEHLLNYPILLSNIALILNLFAFPLSIQLAEWTDLGKKTEGFGILAVLVIFLLGYVWILAVQNAALKMEKTMNPEKRGSLFELNFQKTWESSCDEGQKIMIYKASHQACKITSITCLILWTAALMAQLTLGTGILPVLCVCVIFLVLNVSYIVTSMRLEAGEKGGQQVL